MAIWSFLLGKGLRASARKQLSHGTARRRTTLSLTQLEDRCLLSATLWTQRGGDAGHTCYVDATVNATGITAAWSQSINYTSSGYWAQSGNRGVAIDQTHVYRTELDGYWATGNYHIMAYDLQTGALLWNQTIVLEALTDLAKQAKTAVQMALVRAVNIIENKAFERAILQVLVAIITRPGG